MFDLSKQHIFRSNRKGNVSLGHFYNVLVIKCPTRLIKFLCAKQCMKSAYQSTRNVSRLIDMARTMLREFKMPERFWLEAVNTACHAVNRLYLHRLLKKTSYELLTGNKPNVSYFRVFGSKFYILVKKGRCRRGNSPAGWRNALALNPKMRRGLSILPAS
jgi:hypothetical protein